MNPLVRYMVKYRQGAGKRDKIEVAVSGVLELQPLTFSEICLELLKKIS